MDDGFERALARMRELIAGGRDGGVAATIAEDEYGFDRGHIAAEVARRGAEIRARKRRERGVLTQEEVGDLLRGRMKDPRFDPAVRRAVKMCVLEVMTADRSVRDLRASLVERAEPLDDDQTLIFWHELDAIWGSLPPDLDPREQRRCPFPRTSHLWPAFSWSPQIRWIPSNG